jgi:hypothetical protein
MRILRCLAVALIALGVASCAGQSPKQLLIGKWETVEEKEVGTIEFEKDGKLRGTRGIMAIQGKYRWLDDKTVELDVDNPFAGLASKFMKVPDEGVIKRKYNLVSINQDEFVATDAADGKTLKFKRAK